MRNLDKAVAIGVNEEIHVPTPAEGVFGSEATECGNRDIFSAGRLDCIENAW